MYQTIIAPQTRTLIKNTAKALLFAGQAVKPSDVAKMANVSLHGKDVQKLIDELYEADVQIRRKIVAEGFYVTFTYSRLKKMPKYVAPVLPFGNIATLDLTKYDQRLYVAYDGTGVYPAALFNTQDKYEARNLYKSLVVHVKHNDVRMTRLATYIKAN